ncbi:MULTISPECIES: DoxX family protein [Marinobacter]|uniref:DoxX family protein n=1 Tax=Marinobacter nauticus TaxID=2743 RepID=A0A368XIH6_MARNT|nr:MULTISPECIES: DoxX family protein [Marinobacter]MCG8521599.1 DoxX family protein [Pseudomonadales bacterium]MEC8822787.1 DoxX family protein [Pseudomonadota bacterium]KAE8547316.1 DoxX family protein [Marinobacter nauticus]MAC21990.1 DoxX family protein [Marinobacter sp.]MAL32208.1 DoxX family protein [Marinobacter sp.]
MLDNADLGKLIVRLTLGGLLLFHGIAKLLNGIGFIEGQLASHGLPTILAYGVYIGEVIAPLMVILGYQTRIGALIIVFNMIVAIALVHGHQLLTLSSNGGWALELQGFFLFTALALIFLGPGRYKLKN